MENMKDPEKNINPLKHDESQVIKRRRQAVGMAAGNPEIDALGLGLSGGGIRSAAFNMGLLQAMDETKLLSRVDYLSTVSGGGYIGASLSWFMARLGCDFPFRAAFEKGQPWQSARVVDWIRRHGNYLTPGDGLGKPALVAALLRGTTLNLMITLPVLLLIIWFLTRVEVTFQYDRLVPMEISALYPNVQRFVEGVNVNLLASLAGFGVLLLLFEFLVLFTLYAVSSRLSFSWSARRRANVVLGWLLVIAGFCLVLGSLPWVHSLLKHFFDDRATRIGDHNLFIPGVVLVGLMAIFGSARDKKEAYEKGVWAPFFLGLGLVLLIYGLFLGLYWLAIWVGEVKLMDGINPRERLLILSSGFAVLLGMVSDINRASMHRYYRDRLQEAFMPHPKVLAEDSDDASLRCTSGSGTTDDAKEEAVDPDRCFLHDLSREGNGDKAPYHIINVNMYTNSSADPKLAHRRGDNFIFSPLYTGARSTGWVPTDDYIGGQMTLASAFAISGAAVDPNSDKSTSGALAFLMTLLNFRLGYWAHNPRRTRIRDEAEKKATGWKKSYWNLIGFFQPTRPRFWLGYAFRDMVGLGQSEKGGYVNLSDGGHFENLAAYELIRRRCPHIILSDAGVDPHWTFVDLGNLVEKVRVDFGARIDIVTEPLNPNKNSDPKKRPDHLSEKPFVHGTITYPDGTVSHLLYIKTCFTENLPQDIIAYRNAHPDFPDQSTLDQFFDEMQFEAYRELGYQHGKTAFEAYREPDGAPRSDRQRLATVFAMKG